MINTIYPQIQPNFTGKTIRKTKAFDDLCDETFEKIHSRKKHTSCNVPLETYKAYANLDYNKVALMKKQFGFAVCGDSKALPHYNGLISENSGFSTEAGGYGGGWIKAGLGTPLSTKDIRTCATVNLVNEANNEHLLYHVFHETSAKDIEQFIRETFPKFNKVNIIPGDQLKTTVTTQNIMSALNKINPRADKHFYHFASENPEVVALDGNLSYIPNTSPTTVSFKEVNQYYYGNV